MLSIADFLHNNLRDPLCAKAYLRRATAYRALGDLERAAADLASAVDIEPDNKELVTAHAKVRTAAPGWQGSSAPKMEGADVSDHVPKPATATKCSTGMAIGMKHTLTPCTSPS